MGRIVRASDLGPQLTTADQQRAALSRTIRTLPGTIAPTVINSAATYSPVSTDADAFMIFTNAGGCAITLPAEAVPVTNDNTLAVGGVVYLAAGVAAGYTVAAAGGVTLNAASGLLPVTALSVVRTLVKTDVNTYWVF